MRVWGRRPRPRSYHHCHPEQSGPNRLRLGSRRRRTPCLQVFPLTPGGILTTNIVTNLLLNGCMSFPSGAGRAGSRSPRNAARTDRGRREKVRTSPAVLAVSSEATQAGPRRPEVGRTEQCGAGNSAGHSLGLLASYLPNTVLSQLVISKQVSAMYSLSPYYFLLAKNLKLWQSQSSS